MLLLRLLTPPSLPPSLPQVVADTYEPGDLVLVLDYELMLLPMLLRKRFPDVVCGFFLHCPFPSSEFYRMLPVRQPLLQVRRESVNSLSLSSAPPHAPFSPPSLPSSGHPRRRPGLIQSL